MGRRKGFGKPVDSPECLAGIVEILLQRRTLPVAVAVFSQQDSFGIGKQADITDPILLPHHLHQPAMDGRQHIRHRRVIGCQIAHKFRFSQIVFLPAVAESRDAEHILFFFVEQAYVNKVSATIVTCNLFAFEMIQAIQQLGCLQYLQQFVHLPCYSLFRIVLPPAYGDHSTAYPERQAVVISIIKNKPPPEVRKRC